MVFDALIHASLVTIEVENPFLICLLRSSMPELFSDILGIPLAGCVRLLLSFILLLIM